MLELSLPYINELAKQVAFMSSFLGGFALTFLGALILSEQESKLLRTMIISTATSALAFIVAVVAMTQLIMISTEGYPFEVDQKSLMSSRITGALALFIGIFSLMFTIALSGWMRSRKLGIITTIIGVLAIIAVLVFA